MRAARYARTCTRALALALRCARFLGGRCRIWCARTQLVPLGLEATAWRAWHRKALDGDVLGEQFDEALDGDVVEGSDAVFEKEWRGTSASKFKKVVKNSISYHPFRLQ